MKKLYVIDTSVLLTDSDVIFKYGNNNILIPFQCLEELDKNKNRQDIPGWNARKIIKFLDELRNKGSLRDGIKICKKKGLIFVKQYDKNQKIDTDLDLSIADNKIILTGYQEKILKPEQKVIFVTRDINMRVKCDAIELNCETYEPSHVIEKKEEIYTGHSEILVDDLLIDKFYNKESIFLPKNENIIIYPNQFLTLISNLNEKKTALARFKNNNSPILKLNNHKDELWGIKPKNKEQFFALDLLLDQNIPIVSIIGLAGGGKTLLALASGLQQVINEKKQIYKKLVVSRPIIPVGKQDLGFLPGNIQEKMHPWLLPIEDNLQFLLGNDKIQLEQYIEKGIIEIEALSYIRGRTLSNAYIIVDECQNLSQHEIKTIMTRVGENSKIVLTGDISQIDNLHLNEITNGLTYAIEKFKEYDCSGHIQLLKGERSLVATLSSQIL